jgi:alkanesulfonate monooxygenase SsuD/methylene tetrahydromethanopterin reductase-like flavin-dependent oxidoreductase (luciferase family)
VSWSGALRAPLEHQGVYPRPVQDPLPVWIAVGGTPQSVVRAGLLGLPLALAIIGGQPERFAPLVQLHRRALAEGGHPAGVPVGINSHGFVGPDAKTAADAFFGGYAQTMTRIGRERGWPPLTRAQFDAGLGLHGHLVVGGPEEVAEKILFQHEVFGHDRALVQLALGTVPHRAVMTAIELLGTEVAPLVRAEVARRSPASVDSGS